MDIMCLFINLMVTHYSSLDDFNLRQGKITVTLGYILAEQYTCTHVYVLRVLREGILGSELLWLGVNNDVHSPK